MAPTASHTRAPSARRRSGRPTKQEHRVDTRERLLSAAIVEFVEQGFHQASLTRIAERADISGPAVYKHFDGKADLLIHAARRSLHDTLRTISTTHSPHELARRWLADDFASTRRLLIELHVAAGRESELQALLEEWIRERTTIWQDSNNDSVEQIKVFYLLLLGLAQIDSLSSLQSSPEVVTDIVDRLVDALFSRTDTTN